MTKKKKPPAIPKTEGQCLCIYCEEEIMESKPSFCQACRVVHVHCLNCGMIIGNKKAKKCPECGEPLE
jgi:hypothetical protein